MVGRADHGLVVLNDDDRVAGGGERANDADEAVDVARVQADAGFVEHEQRVDQRRAEAGGEIDALDFAAAQRARGAVQREVAETDLLEVAQARDDGIVGEVGGVGAGGGFGAGGWGSGVFEQREEVGDGELVEPGQGVAVPLPAQGLGLEARAPAGGAGVVGAIAGQEHPHVHFVGLRLEVAEESLEAVPGAGPFLAGLAVVGIAVDDIILLLRREGGKRHVSRDFPFPGKDAEVLLRLAVNLALPRLEGPGVDGERVVGDGQAVVDVDDAAETAAVRAGTQRRIEGEQRGRGGAEGAAGFRRMQAARVVADLRVCLPALRAAHRQRRLRRGEEPDLPLPEVERGLGGLEEAVPVFRRQGDAVLNHEKMSRRSKVQCRRPGFFSHQVVDLMSGKDRGIVGRRAFGIWVFYCQQAAVVALAFDARQNLRPFQAAGFGHPEGDGHRAPGMRGRHLGPDRPRVVILDFLPRLRIEALRDVTEPDFAVIGDLRHRAHGGARGLHRVGLLDGDGGPDVLDGVDPGLGEELEELARVGAERLDVAPLALGMQRLEDERRLARAGHAGDDDVAAQGDIEVEALEVVLADATQPDAVVRVALNHERNRWTRRDERQLHVVVGCGAKRANRPPAARARAIAGEQRRWTPPSRRR